MASNETIAIVIFGQGFALFAHFAKKTNSDLKDLYRQVIPWGAGLLAGLIFIALLIHFQIIPKPFIWIAPITSCALAVFEWARWRRQVAPPA